MILTHSRIFEALLRNDFHSFAQRVFRELNPGRTFHVSWVHEAIAEMLQIVAVERVERKLVINLPPRSAKSTIVSVALPAYLLGRDPTMRVIVVSYNQELATYFSRQTRQVMQSDWYRALFPSTAISMRAAETMFYTSQGGFRMSTSTNGTLTGRGGDVIIIDDPLKGDDAYSQTARDASIEWAMNTLFTRLDDKSKGAIILVQQRQHEDDMSGYMLRTGDWLHLNLPAICEEPGEPILLSRKPLRYHRREIGDVLDPAREPIDVLLALKAQMGNTAFSAQYQQSPIPADGDIISIGWFGRYKELPTGGELVLSIDTASKPGLRNDYSVISVWLIRDNHFYLVDIWRKRVEYPELRSKVIELADTLAPDVILIEDKGSGIGLIQDLKAETIGYPVIAFDPGQYDKETRMRVQSARIETGLVHLPREARWLEEFEKEVRQFPNGSHDDQIDAMSQILEWKRERAGSLIIGSYR